LDDRDAFLFTDNTKLIQIISNLINNALKFTKDGEVEFGYSVKEPMIEFFVSDTGIGIPEDQHKKIFDNFYQVENELSVQYGGTGLGLAISKAYSELLGGRIWLKSQPGKGSVFYFNLPNNKGENETPKLKSQEKLKIIFTSPVKILIAEDNDQNFNLISYQLSDPNIEIVRAINGKIAVDICTSRTDLDLVLMDLRMPVMDGYIATKKIKEIRPELTVIAQTAFVTDKEKAMNSGCVDLISKPFSKDEIIAMVGKHLGTKGSLL
jgi:CheY-like chemotaxis protein